MTSLAIIRELIKEEPLASSMTPAAIERLATALAAQEIDYDEISIMAAVIGVITKGKR